MKKLLRAILILIAFVILALAVSYLVSGGQTAIVNHVTINRPPDVVFDYVADMRNELKWNDDVELVEKSSEGPVGLGTTYRAKWEMSDTLGVTVTSYERPRLVTFQNGGALEVTVELRLSPNGEATDLEARFLVTPHGFARAMFPIIGSQLKTAESKNMQELKRALEQG